MSPAVLRSRPAGGCLQVGKRVLAGFGGRREEVGPQGWPGGFRGEPGMYWSTWSSSCDGLGSDELFGCDVEAVGVALDRLEEPGRWVAGLAQLGAGGDGASSRARICCERLGRRAR